MEIGDHITLYNNLRKWRLIEQRSKKYFKKFEPLNRPKLRNNLRKNVPQITLSIRKFEAKCRIIHHKEV